MKNQALAAIGLLLMTQTAFAQEMRDFVDDTGATIQVPVDPQRIVVLADQIIGTSLIELGANVVAGTARANDDGTFYYRGMGEQFGVTPETLPIASLQEQFDFEKIKSFKPDLIIGLPFAVDYLDQLNQIAPTVIHTNQGAESPLVQYEKLAGLVNRSEKYEELDAIYQARLVDVKATLFPEGGTTYVAIRPDPDNGMIETYRHYGAVTQVPDDLGLTYAKVVDTLPAGTYAGDFSAEAIQDFNMDYVLTTYRPHSGGTPENIFEEMAIVVPGYDAFMNAAINDHIISMPAEYVVPHTFASMHNVLDAVEANAAK